MKISDKMQFENQCSGLVLKKILIFKIFKNLDTNSKSR